MSEPDGRPEPAGIASLCVRHADELRAYLTGLLRDPDLAGDVLQATFVKALEHGGEARTDAKAWLFRVAHNEAIDRKRRAAAEGRAVRKVSWWRRDVEAGSPERSAVGREAAGRVRAAMALLPVEQREVVRLRIEEDLTFAEIATRTKVPLGTVLTRMRLATKKLATALEEERERE